jgi:murein DD-endopeptidase MepM/ murein hydrolase activator NlpD
MMGRVEIRTDRDKAIHVPAPVALVGIGSLVLAAFLAAFDPAAVRTASLDRRADQLLRWEHGEESRLTAAVDAVEVPLRELRREALIRGIAPIGLLAPTPCTGTPAEHASAHLEEAARLSSALAAAHSAERAAVNGVAADMSGDANGVLPSRSPIDLSRDVALFETGAGTGAPGGVHVTSLEGERLDPFTGHSRAHRGLDIAAPPGTPVVAPAIGTVVFAGSVDPNLDQSRGLLGNYIELRHGQTGFTTLYGHLSRIDVRTGQLVRAGDRIGAVGSSGHSTAPHLHYQVMKDGEAQNPLAFIADAILVQDGKSVWYARDASLAGRARGSARGDSTKEVR